MINNDSLIALLPQLVSSALVIVVMMLIAIRRNYNLVAGVTVVGLAATLATIPWASQVAPQTATALFIVDGMSLFYTGLILAAAIGSTLLLWTYMENAAGNREEVFLLLTLSVNGALLLVTARHMASLFVALELMSVPLYGMAGYLFTQRRSLESATKYLVLSAAATSVMLFGMAFLYAQSGRLDFGGVAALFTSGHGLDAFLAQAGLVLLIAGLAFKLSLAPFHQWTLDVYDGAPAPVGAFLATVGKVAVVAVLLRLLQMGGVFGANGEYPAGPAYSLLNVLAVVAVLSILAGNLLALRQESLKRLLAASSIAHFGYLLVAIVAGGVFANEAAGMYLTAYVFTSLGAFGVISVLSQAGDGRDADTLAAVRGLGRRSPLLALALSVMLLSLAGIPLTAGFIGKFYVLAAGMAAGLWWLLGAVVIGSALGLYFYLRVIAAIYAPAEGEPVRVAHGIATLTVILALVTVLVIGVWPQPLAHTLYFAPIAQVP